MKTSLLTFAVVTALSIGLIDSALAAKHNKVKKSDTTVVKKTAAIGNWLVVAKVNSKKCTLTGFTHNLRPITPTGLTHFDINQNGKVSLTEARGKLFLANPTTKKVISLGDAKLSAINLHGKVAKANFTFGKVGKVHTSFIAVKNCSM